MRLSYLCLHLSSNEKEDIPGPLRSQRPKDHFCPYPKEASRDRAASRPVVSSHVSFGQLMSISSSSSSSSSCSSCSSSSSSIVLVRMLAARPYCCFPTEDSGNFNLGSFSLSEFDNELPRADRSSWPSSCTSRRRGRSPRSPGKRGGGTARCRGRGRQALAAAAPREGFCYNYLLVSFVYVLC